MLGLIYLQITLGLRPDESIYEILLGIPFVLDITIVILASLDVFGKPGWGLQNPTPAPANGSEPGNTH